jgi:hypothetical protein
LFVAFLRTLTDWHADCFNRSKDTLTMKCAGWRVAAADSRLDARRLVVCFGKGGKMIVVMPATKAASRFRMRCGAAAGSRCGAMEQYDDDD